MKISVLSAAAALVLGATSMTASAADGTITFKGDIMPTTCEINGGAGDDVTVDMPTIAAAELDAAGKSAGEKPFNITVGSTATPCAASHVQLRFEPGGNVDAATGRLKNTGDAKNLLVEVLNDTGAVINLNDNTNSQTVATTAGVADMKYTARYYATGAVEAGTVDTSVQYTVTHP